MDNPQKQQTAERIKQANNILITVSNNPTVDQLAACIGLTLALNKLNKHATAVFSGDIPSTLEFLQPEKTIEKTTDSLRDFIIALDKAKADKLRYKVEDKVVKIFITPYRTSISDKDLQFSQGDFNVDVVLALGVHNQRELDQAITAHGRILHDAAVITVNVKEGGQLGAINWLEPRASSLSELAVQLIDVIDRKLLDSQISTALLTGIVAETQRFRNDKTSPLTMSYSAELMTAGANQQLVATKLEEPPKPVAPPRPATPVANSEPQGSSASAAAPPPPPPSNEGLLEIQHEQPLALQQPGAEESEPLTPQIDIDQEGRLQRRAASSAAESSSDPTGNLGGGRKILPPSESPMTAGAYKDDETAEAAINPLSAPAPDSTPLLRRDSDQGAASNSQDFDANRSEQFDPASQPGQTLSQIEQAVDSPHIGASQGGESGAQESDLDALRSAVQQAGNESAAMAPQPPMASLGSQPLGDELHAPQQPSSAQNEVPPPPGMQPPQATQSGSSLPPPPGPPPMMPGS